MGAVELSFRSEIPTTPLVSAVIGGRALCPAWASLGALAPVEGAGDWDGADPDIPPARPVLEFEVVPPDAEPEPVPPTALFWLFCWPSFCGPMIAWIDMGICISLPFFTDPKFVKSMLLGGTGDLFRLITPSAAFTLKAEVDFPPIPLAACGKCTLSIRYTSCD